MCLLFFPPKAFFYVKNPQKKCARLGTFYALNFNAGFWMPWKERNDRKRKFINFYTFFSSFNIWASFQSFGLKLAWLFWWWILMSWDDWNQDRRSGVKMVFCWWGLKWNFKWSWQALICWNLLSWSFGLENYLSFDQLLTKSLKFSACASRSCLIKYLMQC